jgi:hypothetical protein
MGGDGPATAVVSEDVKNCIQQAKAINSRHGTPFACLTAKVSLTS